MSSTSVYMSAHAGQRARERQVPGEVDRALTSGDCLAVRIRSDRGPDAIAHVVRVPDGFWVQVICGAIVVTIYHVQAGRDFEAWSRRKLVDPANQYRLQRLSPILGWQDEVTQYLASVWLDA